MKTYLRYSNPKDINEVEYLLYLDNGVGLLSKDNLEWIKYHADKTTPTVISGNSIIDIVNNEPVFNLDKYKSQQIEYVNQLSFDIRNVFLPDYKLINAGIDVYEDEAPGTKVKYKQTVKAFRVEFYRLKGLIESATTNDGVDTIVASENYIGCMVSNMDREIT